MTSTSDAPTGLWWNQAAMAGERRRGPTFLLLALALALLVPALILVGAAGFSKVARGHELLVVEQLRAIALLKVGQIERWLSERRQDAELVSTSPVLLRDLPRWLRDGDSHTRDLILVQLDAMRRIEGFQAVMVMDAAGVVALGVGGHHQAAGPLLDTAARALASGRVEFTDLYHDQVDGEEHIHLDFVAPLGPEAPTGFVVVLRLDRDAFLFPFLQDWPLPSASAETLLVRRDGDAVLFLNALRDRTDTAMRLRLPLGAGSLLAGQVVSGQVLPGEPVRALDYRGVPVLGLALPVAGTAWYLIAKIDLAELTAAERRDLLWLGSALGLALVLMLVSALLLYQRHSLRLARVHQQEQAARLHDLQLRDAVVDASSDAIYAKDLAGTYLLFNRAAADFCATTPEAALGRDDQAIFPPEQAALLMAHDRQVMAEDRTITFQEELTTAQGSITFLATKGPLYDAAGRVVGLFGIARDITERARAEEENRTQLDELRRWQRLVLGREARILELKQEVNTLLARTGQGPRYPSATGSVDSG
ncbi:PAS domain-containing protein [uncultured Lamprocystis sp.]|jgi:PAS domain S-box-containing protein|uniref:PAS domain-containing protein n=2 Tax=uncultured Lamprocystis sp. TaxID=543132 RepID=UPI0025F44A46|nr:PAS domain-containing protein [uncultured Lamprocystis sp.]